MVQYQTLHPVGRQATESPVPYILRMTAFVTCALTIAGGSWYVAVDYTTASDLTAIYNCSAFFAYAFSIPLLHEKVRMQKVIAVAIAIVGVFVVAYGDTSPAKHGSKSGGGAGGDQAPHPDEASNRTLGNLIIGVGSVLYGFYEVLYKRVACPPDGCSPGRSMIFANTFGSLIGIFTLAVLWIPLPILHVMGWERFELPTGEAAKLLLISVLANASKSPPCSYTWTTTNGVQSVFRCISRFDQSHIASTVLGCSSSYYLHRCHRRSTASTSFELSTVRGGGIGRFAYNWSVPPSQLGVLQGDGRRKTEKTG
jgi:drug/metabolite transporter (DMT)-like permease